MKLASNYLQFYGVWKPDVDEVALGGIRVKRVRDGVFSVERLGEGSLSGMISTQVQVADPWCAEKTMVVVRSCAQHGLMCPSLRNDFEALFETNPSVFADCKEIEVGVMVPRWHPVVRSVEDKGKIEIVIYRAAKCTTLAEAKAAPPPEPADAGFFVMVMMPAEPKKEAAGNA